MSKNYYVYILASKQNGTLYTGITGNLAQRVYQHKKGLVEGFTKRYNLKILVHIEEYNNVHDAILREKQIKKWNRQWKIELIESHNPDWRDLYNDLIIFK